MTHISRFIFGMGLVLFWTCGWLQAQDGRQSTIEVEIDLHNIKLIDPMTGKAIVVHAGWGSKTASLEADVKRILQDLKDMKGKLTKEAVAGRPQLKGTIEIRGLQFQIIPLGQQPSKPSKEEVDLKRLLHEVQELRHEVASLKNNASKQPQVQAAKPLMPLADEPRQIVIIQPVQNTVPQTGATEKNPALAWITDGTSNTILFGQSGELEKKIDRLLKEMEELRRDVKGLKDAADKRQGQFQFQFSPYKPKPKGEEKQPSSKKEQGAVHDQLEKLLHELRAHAEKERAKVEAHKQKANVEKEKADAALKKALDLLKRSMKPADAAPDVDRSLQHILQELEALRLEIHKLNKKQ